MWKWIFAVAAMFALGFATPAHALVQETNTTVNKGTEIAGDTIKITVTQEGRPAQSVTVAKGKPSATKPFRIETNKPAKVTVEVNGKVDPNRERTVDGAVFVRDGVNLGGGLTVRSTPVTARYDAPGTAGTTPVAAPADDYWTSMLRYAGEFGGFRIAADAGLTGGANFSPSGGSFIRGVDNFAGANLVDQRSVDLGQNTAFIGGQINIWQVAPGPRWFLTTGVNVPVDSSKTVTQSGINTIPQGDATLKYEIDWQIPLFLGMSFPITSPYNQWIPLQDPRFRVGVGGIFTHGNLSISGVDGAARLPFSASQSFTDFDPGFLVGLRGGIGNGWIVGADLTVTWRDDKSVTAGSASFPGTQSYTGTVGDDTDLSLMFSLSRTIIGGGMMPISPPPPPVYSDIRLKHDIALLGARADGIALYRYRYLWSDTEYVGVMAQEIAQSRPDAVRRGNDGFLRVDYSKLGTRLMTIGEWNSRQLLLGSLAEHSAQ